MQIYKKDAKAVKLSHLFLLCLEKRWCLFPHRRSSTAAAAARGVFGGAAVRRVEGAVTSVAVLLTADIALASAVAHLTITLSAVHLGRNVVPLCSLLVVGGLVAVATRAATAVSTGCRAAIMLGCNILGGGTMELAVGVVALMSYIVSTFEGFEMEGRSK